MRLCTARTASCRVPCAVNCSHHFARHIEFSYCFFTLWCATGQRYGYYFCSLFFSLVHILDEPRYFLQGFDLLFHVFLFDTGCVNTRILVSQSHWVCIRKQFLRRNLCGHEAVSSVNFSFLLCPRHAHQQIWTFEQVIYTYHSAPRASQSPVYPCIIYIYVLTN